MLMSATAASSDTPTVLHHAMLFDGVSVDVRQDVNVLVENGRIGAITQDALNGKSARHVDVRGRFLMPGLIDAHFHAYGLSLDVTKFDHMPMSLLAHHGARMLEGALM